MHVLSHPDTIHMPSIWMADIWMSVTGLSRGQRPDAPGLVCAKRCGGGVWRTGAADRRAVLTPKTIRKSGSASQHSGRGSRTIPFLMTLDETFDVGVDTRTGVNDKDYRVPFRFTGKIATRC